MQLRESFSVSQVSYSNKELKETERKFVLAAQACLCLFSLPLLSLNPQALLDV